MQILFPRLTCFLVYNLTLRSSKVKSFLQKSGKKVCLFLKNGYRLRLKNS